MERPFRGLTDVERRINDSRTPSPYGGDSDPFHLGAHVRGSLEPPPRTRAKLTIHPAGERSAALLLESMTGWYAALIDTASSLPDDDTVPSWKVDVTVRPVGWLGTFRRSRVTGLWFSCRHRHHVEGN